MFLSSGFDDYLRPAIFRIKINALETSVRCSLGSFTKIDVYPCWNQALMISREKTTMMQERFNDEKETVGNVLRDVWSPCSKDKVLK